LWAILCGFGPLGRARSDPDPHVSVLRIRGRAIFGDVGVVTRPPDESSTQARWHLGKQRRALLHADRPLD